MSIPPCIICGKELENYGDSEAINQPMAGTEFITHGHYGSIFDPMRGGVWLTINICNTCLAERSEMGRVLLTEQAHVRPAYTFTRWDANEPIE